MFRLFTVCLAASFRTYFSQDGEFVNLLQEYVENGIQSDYRNVVSGSEELQELRQVLSTSIKDLNR